MAVSNFSMGRVKKQVSWGKGGGGPASGEKSSKGKNWLDCTRGKREGLLDESAHDAVGVVRLFGGSFKLQYGPR